MRETTHRRRRPLYIWPLKRASNKAMNWITKDYINFGCRNYVIEKQNTSSNQWTRVSGCVPGDVTQFKVSRLDEGQTYVFRVCAENDQGCGPALTTQLETLAKNPFGKLVLLSKFQCFQPPKFSRICHLRIGVIFAVFFVKWLARSF